MSAFETNSSSERTSRKKNIVLYTHEGTHKSYPTYQLKQQLLNGKSQTYQDCSLRACYGTPRITGTLEYIIIVNSPVEVSDIILNVPIVNLRKSFVYTVEVLEYYPSYTVKVRYTCLNADSPTDGFSFYSVVLPEASSYVWHNDHCTHVSITSFGGIPFSRQGYQFYNLHHLSISPNSSPTILSGTSGAYMFYQCSDFNPIRLPWNLSLLTSMERMFYECTLFNPESIQWDTSSVISMAATFGYCVNFNPPSLSLNVNSVRSMNQMFIGCTSANVDIRSWNVNNVEDMNQMFYGCTSWTLDLGMWPVYINTTRLYFSTGANIIQPIVWV